MRELLVKKVHQTQSLDRTILRQQVSFCHDRVRERVRQGHQLVAQFRRHSVFCSISEVIDPEKWKQLCQGLPRRKVLRVNLELLRQVYEMLCGQESQLRSNLVGLARREEPVQRFQELPDIGWIRAITFYVYIDVHVEGDGAAAIRHASFIEERLDNQRNSDKLSLEFSLRGLILGREESYRGV